MKLGINCLALLALLFSAFCQAEEWWGNLNWRSAHIQSNESLNENNYGAGVEYVYSPAHSAMAGFYKNSYERTTVYLNYGYTPIQWEGLRLGIIAGTVNGYPTANHGRFTLMGGLILKTEWRNIGANIFVIPSCNCKPPAVIAMQFRFRFN